LRYDTGRPGFRTRQITLVTTLLDAESYRVPDLAEWSRRRWQVETSLAQLKSTMQMDVLHCQADGCAALSNGTRRAKGTHHLCHRLQPGPDGHGPIS
jgi:hypothetical protein